MKKTFGRNRDYYMPGERKESQTVEAFSAPKELLREAQLEAKRRRLSKSGFYRYCLARELGRDEEASLRIAEHAGTGNFQVIKSAGAEKGEASSPVPVAKGGKYPKAKRG